MAHKARLTVLTLPTGDRVDMRPLAMPTPRPQLALVASQDTVRHPPLTSDRRLGAWLCLASTVGFWSALLVIVL